VPVHKRLFLCGVEAEEAAGTDRVWQAFAFEWRRRVAESFDEWGQANRFDRPDRNAADRGWLSYAGLRRANNTRLWATTADQM
jgi:hypothetical protein